MAEYPRYADLLRPDDTGLPLSWGIWGDDDQLGTLNHITPETTVAAARCVERGVRFNLDLPLHLPYALLAEGKLMNRGAPEHTLEKLDFRTLYVHDDKLDGLYLQGSTQWDGLTHMGDPRHGFYNGVSAEQVTQREGTRNGIEHLAEFGVVSRGVLADIPRYYARKGRDWDIMAQQVVTAEDLAACLADQQSELEPGDVLMLRLGWVEAFRGAPDMEARDALLRPWKFSGLSGQEDMWEFLWDRRVAALASDSVTVEVWPIEPPRPSLHLSIARLGLTIGEMFDFEALAADCSEQGDYLAMFTSSPLNLRGGVGSPPNAMAIR